MNTVQFNEEDVSVSRPSNTPMKQGGITNFVITHSKGLITNEKQAHFVLIGFIIVSFIGIFLLNTGSATSGAQIVAPEGSEVEYPTGQPPRLRQ